MTKDKFNQDIADKAISVLKGLDSKITKLNKSSYDYRLAVLNLYNDIELKFFVFCDSTEVKKQSGWKDYFQPELEKTYENLSWSYSNLKRYRNISASESLKADYLKGINTKNKGNSRTDIQKFKTSLKTINSLIPILKDIIKISLTADGTIHVKDLVEEITLTDSEKAIALKEFLIKKTQSISKDLVNPELAVQQQ